MTTALFSHPVCIEHDTGPYHPECSARLKAVMDALTDEAFTFLLRLEAPRATIEQLLRVHPRQHVDHILRNAPSGSGYFHIDMDTVMSAHSGEAALRAAGAVIAAVDAVIDGTARNAFCAVRPPGHHAERDQAMGFCLFNNVAIGAQHARHAHGIKKIAVVDFDVHHGNGTQHLLQVDPDFFYASTHQANAYPGTGLEDEQGCDRNVVNVPLPAGTGGIEFRAAFERVILPALDQFAPDLVMISAGFDGHAADPLAHLRLRTEDFGWVTRELLALAQRHSNGRVVSALEGGYDLDALANSAAEHVRALMGS